MAFIETQFPLCISYGSIGGPEFKTDVDPLDSGAEQRLQRWPVGRHRYDAAGGIHGENDYYSVVELFHAAHGKGDGFRWKDWNDYKTCAPDASIALDDCELVDANGAVAVGDGSTTVFYLAKKYTFGSTTVYRPITKPTGTPLIGLNGGLQTVTTHYTLSSTTGAVTFVSPPALNDVLTCGCEFDVPVRFDTDYLPTRIVNKSGGEFLVDFDIPIIEIKP